jgi:heat shock protein HslJ
MKVHGLVAMAFVMLAAASVVAGAQSAFPFDRDLVLEARPMRGGKRVPVLAISPDGRAQIDLWCKRGQGHATISGDTLMLALGPMSDEPCTPERAQADEAMIAVLASVTNWMIRGDVVTLTGTKTLRLRLPTN